MNIHYYPLLITNHHWLTIINHHGTPGGRHRGAAPRRGVGAADRAPGRQGEHGIHGIPMEILGKMMENDGTSKGK